MGKAFFFVNMRIKYLFFPYLIMMYYVIQELNELLKHFYLENV